MNYLLGSGQLLSVRQPSTRRASQCRYLGDGRERGFGCTDCFCCLRIMAVVVVVVVVVAITVLVVMMVNV